MIEYIKVERRTGTTARCVQMANEAVERGESAAIVAPRMAQLRALYGISGEVHRVAIGNSVAGRRFDEIVVDYNGDGPSLRDREWLEGVLASRLSGPNARMTVFHT